MRFTKYTIFAVTSAASTLAAPASAAAVALTSYVAPVVSPASVASPALAASTSAAAYPAPASLSAVASAIGTQIVSSSTIQFPQYQLPQPTIYSVTGGEAPNAIKSTTIANTTPCRSCSSTPTRPAQVVTRTIPRAKPAATVPVIVPSSKGSGPPAVTPNLASSQNSDSTTTTTLTSTSFVVATVPRPQDQTKVPQQTITRTTHTSTSTLTRTVTVYPVPVTSTRSIDVTSTETTLVRVTQVLKPYMPKPVTVASHSYAIAMPTGTCNAPQSSPATEPRMSYSPVVSSSPIQTPWEVYTGGSSSSRSLGIGSMIGAFFVAVLIV